MSRLKPLSPTLNRAVLALAAKHWPLGWRPVLWDTQKTVEAWIDCGFAPEYWQGPEIALGHQRFPVWAGGSDRTIFGDPAVNHAFRAWHDAWHLRLRAPFTPEGERRVWETQDSELGAWFLSELGVSHDRDAWDARELIRTEILGQLEHQQVHGAFPENQRAFVRAYVKDPARALARRW